MELPGEDGKALLDIITVLEKVVAVFWLSVSPAATGAAHIVWISCQGWIVPVKCGTIKWCMQLGSCVISGGAVLLYSHNYINQSFSSLHTPPLYFIQYFYLL